MDISFLITTYNSGKFIKRCIDSCLNQEKHNLQIEIIIVNDGSTDNTLKILQNYNNLNICKIYDVLNKSLSKNYYFYTASNKYPNDDNFAYYQINCFYEFLQSNLVKTKCNNHDFSSHLIKQYRKSDIIILYQICSLFHLS